MTWPLRVAISNVKPTSSPTSSMLGTKRESVVNAATMLYVTLAAAPLVQLHVNWIELVLSTVIGGLFFGGVVEGLKRLAARSTPKAA